MEEKRIRASNYTQAEVKLLLDLVVQYKNSVENKKTDNNTNKEKERTWEEIAQNFNAISGDIDSAPRTAKTLKLKYEGLKKATRKKALQYRISEAHSPDFNEVDVKILNICSNVIGLDASNDCEDIDQDPLKHVELQKHVLIEKTAKKPEILKVASNMVQKKTTPVLKAVTKAPVTGKLDNLSEARLQLVMLQIQIAKNDLRNKTDEHNLKMQLLRLENRRKQEYHNLKSRILKAQEQNPLEEPIGNLDALKSEIEDEENVEDDVEEFLEDFDDF